MREFRSSMIAAILGVLALVGAAIFLLSADDQSETATSARPASEQAVSDDAVQENVGDPGEVDSAEFDTVEGQAIEGGEAVTGADSATESVAAETVVVSELESATEEEAVGVAAPTTEAVSETDRSDDSVTPSTSGSDDGASSPDGGSGENSVSESSTTNAPVTASPAPTTTAAVAAGLSWGYDDTAPSASWTRPPLGQVVFDPAYGTELQRVTSAEGTRFDRNTYSRRQAENADGSYFLTYHGTATYRVYQRSDNSLVSTTDIHPNADPQWHPTNPAILRHTAGANSSVGDLSLYETNVNTGQRREIANLTSQIQATMPTALYLSDRSEGSPSIDGNHYAWMVYDSSETAIGVISYDLASNRVLGFDLDLDEGTRGALDFVTASPSGRYVVYSYGNGVFVRDSDLGNERQISIKTDHSDLALDANGVDSYVYVDFSSGPDAGFVVSVNLDDLSRARMFEVYGGNNTSLHISGKGYDQPGWVVISSYNCKDPGAWTCDKVFAAEMVPNGRILNLAHTYNCGNNYWTEPHAVVTRNFARVYFNTDFGSCGIDAEVVQVTVPSFE